MKGIGSFFFTILIWIVLFNYRGLSIQNLKPDPRHSSTPINAHRLPVVPNPGISHNRPSDLPPVITHRVTLREIEESMEFERIPIISTPFNPFFLEFHMTRYFGECFKYFDHNLFNPISLWIRNFQIIVGFCSIDWKTSLMSYLPDSCAFKFHDDDPKQIEFYAHYNITFNPGVVRRIHIHSDRRHFKYFNERILPYLEKRAMLTGERYTVHTGGGDASQMLDVAQTILNSKVIKHWIIEQNILDEIIHHPKVIQLPVGICGRENSGQLGLELRQIIKADEATELNESESTLTSTKNGSDLHRLLFQAIDQSKLSPFHQRLNRILFCFSDSYPKRKLILDYLYAHPELAAYCDICGTNYSIYSNNLHRHFVQHHRDRRQHPLALHSLNSTSFSAEPPTGYALTHTQLWELYTKYKFVFSPWGNGPDCGRSWEILLLGAIPIIQYFAGAHGYLKANLQVILLHQELDLNEQNITSWIQNYPENTPVERLSRDYWNDYLFHYRQNGKM